MIMHTSALLLAFVSFISPSWALRQNWACPLALPAYPAPTSLSVNAAIHKTGHTLTALINGTNNGSSYYGDLDLETTAFSIDIYSLHDNSSLFTYHHTPPSLLSPSGVSKVSSDTIYRIGSVSKLLTAYLYLIVAGDSSWNDPITKYVPELAKVADSGSRKLNSTGAGLIQWNQITVGALASHLAGIPRVAPGFNGLLEAELDTVALTPPSLDVSAFCGDAARLLLPCNRTSFFDELSTLTQITPPFLTPLYSNTAYQILGYALEDITSKHVEEIFLDGLVEPLNLQGTSYSAPRSSVLSAIPLNETISWYNADALDETPAGGYYSSIVDMQKIGKAILNSTLISPVQTARWMKPHSFTSNINSTVGAPWEIFRSPIDRTSWMYTKSGDIGLYSSMIALLKDYDVGFSVMAAGLTTDGTVDTISSMIAGTFVPILEEIAKHEANSGYTGEYTDAESNSTVTIGTDDNPGLVVSQWTINGLDAISLLGQVEGSGDPAETLVVRLFPTNLHVADQERSQTEAWRATFETFPKTGGNGVFSSDCTTWFNVDALTYGEVGLDEFIFTVDHAAPANMAVSIEHSALGLVFERNITGTRH